MLDAIVILLFAAGINWVASLHQVYQASNSIRQKRTVIFLSIAIGIVLGYLATL